MFIAGGFVVGLGGVRAGGGRSFGGGAFGVALPSVGGKEGRKEKWGGGEGRGGEVVRAKL